MSFVTRASAFLVAFVLAFCGIGAMPASADQQPPDTAISMYVDDGTQTLAGLQSAASDIEKSIVLVGITWEGNVLWPEDQTWNPATVTYLCTGWFVSSEGDIVTAGHCVAEDDQLLIDLVDDFIENGFVEGTTWTDEEITYAEQNWEVDTGTRTVEVVQPSHVEGAVITDPQVVDVRPGFQPIEDGDHALLKLNGYEDTPALKVADVPAKVGDDVTTVGFSDDVSSMVDVDSDGVTSTKGSVSSVDHRVDGTPFTGVDVSMDNKMSGGPTFNGNNEVLGVNSFGSDDGSADLNYISDNGYLQDFLAANGVELANSSGNESGGNGGSGQSGPAKSPRSGSAASSDDGGIPTWVYFVGGGVLLLIVIVFGLVRRNRGPVCNTCRHRNRPNAQFCSNCRAPFGYQPTASYPAQPDQGDQQQGGYRQP